MKREFRIPGVLVSALLALTLTMATSSLMAQSQADLTADHTTPGDVLTYGMGYNNQRYSALKAINKGNVANLVPTWNYSLNNSQSAESQPIIHDGVMYITSHTHTMAVNALTGRQIWKQEVELPADFAK